MLCRPAHVSGHILNLQSVYFSSFVRIEDHSLPSTVLTRKRRIFLKSGKIQMILHFFNALCGNESGSVHGGFFVSKSTEYNEEGSMLKKEQLLRSLQEIIQPD
jgi:hypothetical protein